MRWLRCFVTQNIPTSTMQASSPLAPFSLSSRRVLWNKASSYTTVPPSPLHPSPAKQHRAGGGGGKWAAGQQHLFSSPKSKAKKPQTSSVAAAAEEEEESGSQDDGGATALSDTEVTAADVEVGLRGTSPGQPSTKSGRRLMRRRRRRRRWGRAQDAGRKRGRQRRRGEPHGPQQPHRGTGVKVLQAKPSPGH